MNSDHDYATASETSNVEYVSAGSDPEVEIQPEASSCASASPPKLEDDGDLRGSNAKPKLEDDGDLQGSNAKPKLEGSAETGSKAEAGNNLPVTTAAVPGTSASAPGDVYRPLNSDHMARGPPKNR